MKASLRTISLLGLLLLVLHATGLLGHSRALGARPTMAGTWDTLFDDVVDVSAEVEGDEFEARTGTAGGRVAFHDAGALVELEVDCTRPELICPHELFPRELVLDNRSGDLSDDGEKFVLSFEGEGSGACRLLPGSMATATVELEGAPHPGPHRRVGGAHLLCARADVCE